jgi:hypothetical protein
MRAKLSRNIDYHAAMQEHYLAEDKKEKEAHPPAAGGARGAPKPPQSASEKLAEMHGDVAKQLTDVLAADPEINAVERVQASARPLRQEDNRLKPDAGWFTKRVIH